MKVLLIETNQTCNFRCKYCFYNDYGRFDDVITPKKFEKIIKDELATHVYLTGGETTESEYFINYVDICKENNVKCTVFTNGWNLLNYEGKILHAVLEKLDCAIISLDSCDKNYKIRPLQSEIYLKLKKLRIEDKDKLKIKISVNYFNIENFETTIKSLIEIGIKNLSINIVHNINASQENYELSIQVIKKMFEIMDKYIIYFDENYIKYLKDYYIMNQRDFVCAANKTFKFYNCRGESFPCPSNYKKGFNCVTKECICLWEMYNEK